MIVQSMKWMCDFAKYMWFNSVKDIKITHHTGIQCLRCCNTDTVLLGQLLDSIAYYFVCFHLIIFNDISSMRGFPFTVQKRNKNIGLLSLK